jgi:selT/selW/selH-like putative selenoprotein
MDFEIRYCRPCGYRGRADDLAAELRRRFDARVRIAEGKFGQFDVLLDGIVVASKGRTFLQRMLRHGTPSQPELVDTIERHLAVRTGDACDLPPADENGRS